MQLSILGIPVNLQVDPIQWLTNRFQYSPRQGGQIITLNTEMVMLARQNPDLAALINNCDLVIPDGAGVVLYASLSGHKISRCPGIELAEYMLTQAANTSLKVFFLGAAPGVAAQAAQNWQAKLPGLVIAGVSHGYFSPEEEPIICQELAAAQPDLLLVALGIPRQEFWIAAHRFCCPQALCIGVGGSFDVWSGQKKRAPKWMGQANLEWLYRLYQEPGRWQRMLVLPKFIWCTIQERLWLIR